MGKHKDKSKKHKKTKKHMKKDRRSPSISSTSSEEWIEKKSISAKEDTNKNKQERDDWMSMSSSIYTTLSSDKRLIREENRKLEKEQSQYNPKESIRELNPYWKDGGDGLPSFKKPTENYDSNYKPTPNRYSHSSNWRKKNDNEQTNQDSKYGSSVKCVTYRTKQTDQDSKHGSSVKCITDRIKQTDQDSKHGSSVEGVTHGTISNKDLNVLAAKLVKAELMGNTELIKELKIQLDEARNLFENTSSNTENETSVLLTTTDSRGMSRPLKTDSQYGESSGTQRNKKQKTETHVDNQRVKYFADDDKYSLKQMFENEKYISIDEQNKQFLKIASKAKTDLDDFFVDEIRKQDSDKKIKENDLSKAINTHKLMSKSLDNCNYCLQSDIMNKNLMISMGETIYLSVPYFEPITENHCLLAPVHHVPCATQLDENYWAELITFRKALCNMFKSIDKDVIFFETALGLHRYPHMILECVPVSKEQGDLAPIYFKKAIDESETEWSSNKKLVSLSGRDVRRAIPKGLPYFAVSFGMTEGYAHVIEDEKMFPQNFAQEIIGGMLDLDHSKWRKLKRQNFEQQKLRVLNFTKMWCNFDCTV